MKKFKYSSKIFSYAILLTLFSSGYLPQNVFAEEPQTNINEFTLDTVIVTASRIPETITEAKADVSVVTRKQIEEMHMETVEEALRTVPGVQFLNYGANGINANLSGVRINGSKDIVVLVDGVRVTDFQGANNSGYMYASLLNNMDNIERIEILRGAAGTMYGSTAKGGVINIITRDIKANKTVIDMSNGSYGKENYKINTQGKVGNLSYNIYYGKSLTGDTKDGDNNTWEGHTDTKNLGTKFIYNFSDDNKLTVSYDEIKSDYNGQDYIYVSSFLGDYKSRSLTVKHDINFSNLWSNSMTYRKSHVESHYGKPEEGNYSTSSDYDYDFFSDQVNYITDRNHLVFGFDYSKGKNNLLTRVGFDEQGNRVSAKRSMENYSYYIQDDWEIIPRVTLSGGIRYDKPKGDEYSPDMESYTSKSYKLSWDITDNDTIYAGRSDFYILPDMEQRYNEQWGNAELQPAYGRTSSIGYSKKFDDYNIFTFNWYKTESERTIGYTPVDDNNHSHFANFDDGISKGWNAQFLTQIGDRWSANLGWSHLYQNASGDNYAMGYYPKDLATMGVYYNYAKVSAGLTGFYFMRKVNPNVAKHGWPADDYGVFNLSLNYSPTKNLTFYTKVDNIFDKLWAEHTDVVHNGRPGTWYAMPGRCFIVGMQLKF